MRLRNRFLLWLLRKRRPTYLKLKRLNGLAISRDNEFLDLYESTYQGLGFFYPRMLTGGIIVAHDYSNLTVPGVRKAFSDFFKDKPEPILPLWETQCAVVKLSF
jgi:hypothetical protein